MDLTINPKFKELLPPLTTDEYAQLEQSLLDEGCRDAILVWRNQIVDGHNRLEICEKHGLQYRSIDMPFAVEDEALEWIYINQLGRRNLTEQQRTLFIGRLYNLRKSRQGGTGSNQYAQKSRTVIMTTLQNNKPAIDNTAEQMADEFGVGEKTVRRAGKIAEAVEKYPELKQIPTQKDALTIAKNLDAVPPAELPAVREKLQHNDPDTLTTLAEKPPMPVRDFVAAKDTPGVRWADLIYKMRRNLTSVTHHGGIEGLWKEWLPTERQAHYQEVRELEQAFAGLREHMEELLNASSSEFYARQNEAQGSDRALTV